MCDKKSPDMSGYLSTRVYDGIRRLSPEEADKYREFFKRVYKKGLLTRLGEENIERIRNMPGPDIEAHGIPYDKMPKLPDD